MTAQASPDPAPCGAADRPAATLFAVFVRACASWTERDFLHAPSEALNGAPAFDMRYGRALMEVEALVARYRAAGYGAGHRVALALDNHPLFFLHLLALNALGASVVPLNMGAQPAELRHVLAASGAALVVAWPEHRGSLDAAVALLTERVPSVVGVEGALPDAPDVPPFAQDEAAMLFTSGTTGTPKGCILSNDYFVHAGRFYAALGGWCAFEAGRDRILTPLPVTHMNALAVSFMAAMEVGACLIQLDRFHASTWWHTVRESRATVIHYLGVMPAILLQAPPREDDRDGLRIRFAFGAGVDPRHHAAFEQRFGFPLIEAWAMTETGAGAWITANSEPRHVGTRCFGKAPDGIETQVVGEDGRPVADGQEGELLVRAAGPDPRRHFFSGYHGDAEATEAAWAGGWFHTGDIVRRDAEGSFYFVDRNKNIVRRSGENIASIEVEGALMRHAAVGACAVLPVVDEIRGEEVMALVVPAPGYLPDAALAERLARHCLDALVYFKAPGYVAFVDALPTTASQKLQRGAIRSLGRSLVAAGTAFDLRPLKRRGGGGA